MLRRLGGVGNAPMGPDGDRWGRMVIDGQTDASTPRDGAWALEAASDARTYATLQPSNQDSSNSDGYLARTGTGGVDGRPMDSGGWRGSARAP